MSKKLLFSIFLFCQIPLFALELTLEENKAESGTIGYVDIEKVFKRYSIKIEARDKFLEKIKEKEEILNSKKEEIGKIKNQILKLKQEKELAISLNELYKSFNEKASEFISNTSSQVIQNSSTTYQTSVSSEVLVSTENFKTETSTIASSIELTILDSETAKIPVISMPGVGNIPMSHFKFSISTSVADIEKAITEKENELSQKENELKKLKKDFDKELLEYEDAQTEKILGNIYIKLKELSIKEGVSVVVDKKSILFGHKAVDLTDKLIEELGKD